MSVRTPIKLLGAAGAAALVVGTMASTAVAASTDVSYTCDVLGATSVSLDPGTVPAKLVAGQVKKNAMTAVVHLDVTQTATAKSFGDNLTGTVTASGAKKSLPFKLTIPSQAIPTIGNTMDVNSSGTATFAPTTSGSWKVTAGDLSAMLQVDGSDLPVDPLNCAAPTAPATVLGTVAVSKDGSKTTVKASAKKGTVSASAKVAGSKYKLAGTGKVKFTLKKGSKTVKSMTAPLKKGTAKAAFKKIKAKGSYTVTAKFSGDGGLKGSSGKKAFKIK